MKISLAVTVFALLFAEIKSKKTKKSDSEDIDESSDYDYSFEINRESVFDLNGLLRQRFGLIAALHNPNDSSICSPLSALIPLGKLALGATSTASVELNDAIGISTKNDTVEQHFSKLLNVLENLEGVVLNLANILYVSEKHQLCRNYNRQVRKIFKSAVKKANFDDPKIAVMNINKWVSSKTRDMIPQIVSPDDITPQSSLVMVNAIYFSGKWKHPFQKTKLAPFYAPNGVRTVEMMSNNMRYYYMDSKVLSAQLLQIPYAGEESSFLIVLPKRRDGLQSLLVLLKKTPKLLSQEMEKMRLIEVNLSMPKFRIESTWDLKKLYKQIGVETIFRKRRSGLNQIVRKERIYVSAAIQKAVIEVTEQGTEGSAASAIMITLLSSLSATVVADRPFMFFVLASNQQLFSGVYV